MIISHNLAAMNAQRQYNISAVNKQKSTEKLSSGFKINRAADDAAGLTISEKMRSQIRGLNQGSDNIQDGISLVQIADGALAEVNDMLHRMTELSIKSANGTNTSADRAAIQKEITQLKLEIDRVAESTEFNTLPLFKDRPDPITGSTGKATKIVKCSAYDSTGGLSEPYHASNGKYYPSASLDFSSINSNNIDMLDGKYFSFVCGWGCGESFEFNFKNDGTGDSASGLGASHHVYSIDLSDISSGNDIVNKICTLVQDNKPTYQTPESTLPDGVPASHSARIANTGNNKLTIYSADPSNTPQGAKNIYPQGTRGSIDCSSISGLFYPKPIKGFDIVCSGSENDDIYIESKFLSCELLFIDNIDVSTELGARRAIERCKFAGEKVSAMRSDYGAYQNRLEHSLNNNENKAENTTAAESRIRDTDMASEMVKFSLQNIISQAGEAMMAQANQSTQGILTLLGQ